MSMILVFFEATEQFLTGATPALSSGDEASVLAVRLLFEYIAHPHTTQRCAGVGGVAFQCRPTGQFGIGQPTAFRIPLIQLETFD